MNVKLISCIINFELAQPVFKITDRQTDRQTGRRTDAWTEVLRQEYRAVKLLHNSLTFIPATVFATFASHGGIIL